MDTVNISFPNLEEIEFEDIFRTTEKAMKYFKEQNVNVIIAVTHLSLEDDLCIAKKVITKFSNNFFSFHK